MTHACVTRRRCDAIRDFGLFSSRFSLSSFSVIVLVVKKITESFPKWVDLSK